MCHQSGVGARVHIYSLTYGQSIICFYMMGLGANFIIREVPSSANIYANCHYIYQDTFSTYDTQFLQVIGFHDVVSFSVSLIPLYHHRIQYFPVMGVKGGGGGGCIFLRKEGMKKGRGTDAPFHTMLKHTGNMFRKNLRDLKPFRSYSRSHLYAQLRNALQKHVFCIFGFDNGCFKRFHQPIFSFQCPKVKILPEVRLDPICPNLPIRSKINVNKS